MATVELAVGPARHTTEPAASRLEPGGWEHQPGLDGLRAVAVAVVLLYHARIGWMGGGFLGVSAFFTLSGFLITSLVVREHQRSDHIDLRRFWGRRIRRLLPAALATQAFVVLLAVLGAWDNDQLRSLRGDVPAALAQVVNWHFILGDRSYGDRFSSPSPLEHFWSLAVEEQFYLVFPVIVLAGLRLGRGRIRPLVLALAAATVISAAVNGWLATGATDRAYFGTDTRLAELTVGALLGCLTLPGLVVVARWRAWVIGLGLIGFAGSAALWVTARTSDQWLYPWGLLATACATCAMILAAVQPGPIRQVLSTAPLQWLGRVSYGVYLLHWPIFLWLSPARTGWSTWPLLAVRLAVTFVAAEAMYRLVEQPVRSRRLLRKPESLLALPVVGIAILVVMLTTTQSLPRPSALQVASASGPPTTAPPVVRAQRVLVVGDELAASLGGGWQPDPAQVELRTESVAGCGLAIAGYVRLASGLVERDSDRCQGIHDRWTAAEREFRPDVVVIWVGVRDLADRRLMLDAPWLAPGAPALSDVYATEANVLGDDLAAGGAQLVWLNIPTIRNTKSLEPVPPGPRAGQAGNPGQELLSLSKASENAPPPGFAENDDPRVLALNAQVQRVVATRPGERLMDIASWIAEWPGGAFNSTLRSDGLRLDAVAAQQAGEWLTNGISELRRETAPSPPAPSTAGIAQAPPAPPAGPRRVAAGRPVRVLVLGDSVSFEHGLAVSAWSARRSDTAVINNAVWGCPVARGGSYRYLGEIQQFGANCDWSTTAPAILRDQDPDVVLVTTGIWEVVDRILPGESRWRSIGDPVVDEYLRAELLSLIDLAGRDGATVAVVNYPRIEAGQNQGFTGLPESDPARIDRLNVILAEVVAARPGVARLVPFREWLEAQPGGELDPLKRDDGVHFRDEYAPTIGAWLGPQLLAMGQGR